MHATHAYVFKYLRNVGTYLENPENVGCYYGRKFLAESQEMKSRRKSARNSRKINSPLAAPLKNSLFQAFRVTKMERNELTVNRRVKKRKQVLGRVAWIDPSLLRVFSHASLYWMNIWNTLPWKSKECYNLESIYKSKFYWSFGKSFHIQQQF